MGRFASLGGMPPGLSSPRRFVLLVSVLMVAVGCTTLGASEPSTTPPDATATAVRRAKIADVQRVIAGNLNPTPLPQPTATQPPVCASALWWYEARDHVG